MILITGAKGQLGYDFQRLFDEIDEKYIATDRDELDITDIKKVREFVKDKNITLIINCAAYNNVDKAEDELEICKKLNTYAPRDLAIVATEIGADYITYSTDFVFDGEKKAPYIEEDIPNPLSVYGRSKYEGEKEVFKVKPDSFVVRTSWVFGIANNNFNKQVINWSKSKDELSIVDDQISSPTYSKDLAYYSWELIKTKKYGLYHLSNDGEASKYDQGKYVLAKIDWQGKLNRAKTKDFNLKAKRAEYTKLDSSKLEKAIGKKIPSWQNGIDSFLEEIKENKSDEI
jgi:dTDP-4-dehydrorhamnose reductase